jgi:alpha-galactosidase
VTINMAEHTPARHFPPSSGPILIHTPEDGPARFAGLSGLNALLRPTPLVEIFTATEQRARTSQSYVRSAVGERLRHRSTSVFEGIDATIVTLVQHDSTSGLLVTSTITKPSGVDAVRVSHRIENTGSSDITLTAVASLVIGFGRSDADLDGMGLCWAESEWLAENRWHEELLRERIPRLTLPIHEQDGRGRFAITSHGAWSTGEAMPLGIVAAPQLGASIAWQIESGVGWQWSIGQTLDGGFLALSGPADLEHQFAHRLQPGAAFDTVPVALAFGDGARDSAVASLTKYRRWLRPRRASEQSLPIIYNDFMNTLMGDPSSEKLAPLIQAAADSGVEYFCIDAGWFAPLGDYWDSIGTWVEHPDRFSGGFRSTIDAILERGMRAGTWLEPEVIGVTSPAASTLPNDAFFQRFGERVREHDRYHLDFRHPAAVAHLNEVVDRLVRDYSISYLKLDYNINPGAGTDWQAMAAGDGLLAHSRAFIAWLNAIQTRYPDLILENCSSGAMRMDYAYLSRTHLQSTSDQQDFRLYPVIAASAPMAVLPEQAGNWAYPDSAMSDEETVFSLVSGLAGRLYLSGFLDQLRPTQQELVKQAVEHSKQWRHRLATATPFWPIGLPKWDDETIGLGFHCDSDDYVLVWSRHTGPAQLRLPIAASSVEQVFPAVDRSDGTWATQLVDGDLTLSVPGGYSARIYRTFPITPLPQNRS